MHPYASSHQAVGIPSSFVTLLAGAGYIDLNDNHAALQVVTAEQGRLPSVAIDESYCDSLNALHCSNALSATLKVVRSSIAFNCASSHRRAARYSPIHLPVSSQALIEALLGTKILLVMHTSHSALTIARNMAGHVPYSASDNTTI